MIFIAICRRYNEGDLAGTFCNADTIRSSVTISIIYYKILFPVNSKGTRHSVEAEIILIRIGLGIIQHRGAIVTAIVYGGIHLIDSIGITLKCMVITAIWVEIIYTVDLTSNGPS